MTWTAWPVKYQKYSSVLNPGGKLVALLFEIVYAVEFGKWDYREWAKKPDEKLAEFKKYFEQCMRREEKDAAVNNGQGMVHIIDWAEFSLSHNASPKGEQ